MQRTLAGSLDSPQFLPSHGSDSSSSPFVSSGWEAKITLKANEDIFFFTVEFEM
jgi:hypothetical protein